MEWSNSYSYTTCMNECKAKEIKKLCGCIPYYFYHIRGTWFKYLLNIFLVFIKITTDVLKLFRNMIKKTIKVTHEKQKPFEMSLMS